MYGAPRPWQRRALAALILCVAALCLGVVAPRRQSAVVRLSFAALDWRLAICNAIRKAMREAFRNAIRKSFRNAFPRDIYKLVKMCGPQHMENMKNIKTKKTW